jgi:alpha-glucosidase
VDPLFGTEADLVALLDALHDRGIRLLLDWVPDHTSDQHPWFRASRSSRDDPRRAWYVWRDPLPDGSPPNNWRSNFGDVPAWTYDEHTGQSYLHVFLAEQPNLNWATPGVEAAMHDTLRYWLDRGVDGFRADVVHLIGIGDDVADLPPEAARAVVHHLDRPAGHERIRAIRRLLDGYPQAPLMVGEVNLMGPGEVAGYLGDPAHDTGELHLAFDFRPLHTPWAAAALHRAIDANQREFAAPHWPTWVLSNHDEVRHRTRYGSEPRARAAAVLSLTVRGTPFLYAGEELGLEDAEVGAARAVDPGGRDGCRSPIPWTAAGDDEHGHGWPRRPWLPFPRNAATHDVEHQRGEPGSTYHLYRTLLATRRCSPALRRGEMELAPLDGEVLRYARRHADEVVEVAINTSDEAVPWPHGLDGELLVSSVAERTAGGGRLLGCEAVVVRHLASG